MTKRVKLTIVLNETIVYMRERTVSTFFQELSNEVGEVIKHRHNGNHVWPTQNIDGFFEDTKGTLVFKFIWSKTESTEAELQILLNAGFDVIYIFESEYRTRSMDEPLHKWCKTFNGFIEYGKQKE